MKRVKNISLILVILLIASCKKFLQESPTSFLTPSDNASSSKVARALANGCYAYLQGMLAGQPSSYGGNTWNLMEFMTVPFLS